MSSCLLPLPPQFTGRACLARFGGRRPQVPGHVVAAPGRDGACRLHKRRRGL